MKAILTFLLAASTSAVAAEPARQEAPAPAPPAAGAEKKPAPAPRIRFRGKAGAPTNTTLTATRSSDQSKVTLMAMAPGNEGVTLRTRPRLWWWQSAATAAGDLEFVLSRIDGTTPQVLLQRPLTAMKAGFNHVDFRNERFNSEGVTLEGGAVYQWTIVLTNEEGDPQVFCRLTTRFDETATDIASLAESGNWYELFDLVCTSAEAAGAPAGLRSLRNEIISQAGLTPPK